MGASDPGGEYGRGFEPRLERSTVDPSKRRSVGTNVKVPKAITHQEYDGVCAGEVEADVTYPRKEKYAALGVLLELLDGVRPLVVGHTTVDVNRRYAIEIEDL
jgi:hypothetical protein